MIHPETQPEPTQPEPTQPASFVERTHVADLAGHTGELVTVAGWVQTLRLQSTMQFVLVRDHTGVVQVTHRKGADELTDLLDSLTTESAVRITGRVVANPVVKLGGLELLPESVELLNRAAYLLPIDEHPGPNPGSTGASWTCAAGPPPSWSSPSRAPSSRACASTRTVPAAPSCTPRS